MLTILSQPISSLALDDKLAFSGLTSTRAIYAARSNDEKKLQFIFKVDAYQSIEEMSELYFFMDPNKFTVKCYLHFISLDDPKAFIAQLLEAKDDF